MIPKMRFAVAVIAFPVPRSLVGNSSGVMAYRTPYMMLLVKLYAQFHPRSALELRAVVDIRMNTPVRTMCTKIVNVQDKRRSRWQYIDLLVDIESVPRRPRIGSSTIYPASSAPGTPMTLRITCYMLHPWIKKIWKDELTYIPIRYIDRPITKICTPGHKASASVLVTGQRQITSNLDPLISNECIIPAMGLV